MADNNDEVKRYHLVIPMDLYKQVKGVADRRQTTVVALLRTFIRLGLTIDKLDENPDTALFVREGEDEARVLII